MFWSGGKIDIQTVSSSKQVQHGCIDSCHDICLDFDHIHERLISIRDANCEIFDPAHHAASAVTIQAFLSGAVSVRFPNKGRWMIAYASDQKIKDTSKFVLNPSTITNKGLKDINHNYCAPLQKDQIIIKDDMFILREPIRGYDSYTRLQIVPQELFSIIFIAFHSNPIGGHINA